MRLYFKPDEAKAKEARPYRFDKSNQRHMGLSYWYWIECTALWPVNLIRASGAFTKSRLNKLQVCRRGNGKLKILGFSKIEASRSDKFRKPEKFRAQVKFKVLVYELF